MSWLAKLLSDPDHNVRAQAVNCPRCWAEPKSRCYKMSRDKMGRWNRSGGRRTIPHSERFTRLKRRTGQ